MGHIKRDENGYSNTEDSSKFCVKSSPYNIAAALFQKGGIALGIFNGLTPYLKGQEFKRAIGSFEENYEKIPHFNYSFATCMEAYVRSVSKILPLVAKDVWTSIDTFADIGGGSGYMSIELCKFYPALKALSCDLKPLQPVFDTYMAKEDPALA